ncbi:Enoyl-[acyl-carrier-protein] reductase, mitochondrial [Seminavis robusta]|uniref:Enoyl-[acyl-carrier-protein] reductase, mitochondrial n=1 Tax=Seminavis robusta TaxID=568900 RepID=A0A9N8DFA4_9STRA|nr:Enoyl-[acyl-carrier-protein] reductase, mitochondrial [Seminavis robusta]|eukprot:Sro61_g035130.1 Enoyl-[acyl-carrier-protein] reductase, mitochondrial (396) ;mRNA; r:101727-102914
MISTRHCRTLTSRILRVSHRTYHELSFLQTGDPSEVLQHYSSENQTHQEEPDQKEGDFVRVHMLAAPWNPADMNVIQGKYPSPVKNPPAQPPSWQGPGWRVAGSEGWGRVMESSTNCNIDPGTLVTLGQSGMGTFRSSLWLPTQAVIPVDRGEELEDTLGSAMASSIFQLGGTALRMLQDFESLGGHSGVVVQNAGNSAVGWMVSQLAATQNVKVVSLVRRGSKTEDEYNEMVDALTQQSTNTTRVIAQDDLLNDKGALKALQAELGTQAPRLAINATGGDSATLLLKLLAPGGTMVTYGGLSMQPVTVATPMLIFKDVKVRGYWHSRWMLQSFPQQRKKMVDELAGLVLDKGVQCPPIEIFSLDRFQDAFQFETEQSAQAVRRKVVFDCQEEAQ